MADDDERFRLKMTWLRDEKGNLIAHELGKSDDPLEDIDGVIYFSDLVMGSPYDAIMVQAASDVHDTSLRRIEVTFEDVCIVLERTEERATLGDRADEERQVVAPPVPAERVLRWH